MGVVSVCGEWMGMEYMVTIKLQDGRVGIELMPSRICLPRTDVVTYRYPAQHGHCYSDSLNPILGKWTTYPLGG